MPVELILLFLFAGIPYYLLFEKTNIVGKDKIFLLSALLVVAGMVVSYNYNYEISTLYIVIALMASLFSLYKANGTNNLYKLSYYILFFNAPMLFISGAEESVLYAESLLVSLVGVYLMGKYYERSYGSANYRSVSGITLVTPYAGLILTIYFTALALYPPFPNALFFFNSILHAEINLLWYLTVGIIFFGNFIIAVRVMAKTVFGKPNENVHYIDVAPKERFVHLVIFIILLILSSVGIQELLL
ncbi:MAG: hypothetical protein R3302_02995 [Sulfurimonadaceae bacterium]|nr:hypothetical protein [Sulfurimonadaceae bacterium]